MFIPKPMNMKGERIAWLEELPSERLQNIQSRNFTVLLETAQMHLLDSMLEFQEFIQDSKACSSARVMLQIRDVAVQPECLAWPHLASRQNVQISMERHGAVTCAIYNQISTNLCDLCFPIVLFQAVQLF